MKTTHRVLAVLLAVALASIGAIALVYAVENRRGARLWAETRRDLQAHGASFEPAAFIPAPIPDDQNLALAPFFARLYLYRVDPATGLLTFNREGNANATKTTDTIPFGLNGGQVGGGPGWATGYALELEKFQRYYRSRADFPHGSAAQSPADDVLLALTRFAPLVDELTRATGAYPQARFPVNWTQRPPSMISLPHCLLIQRVVTLLRLRACASLAVGQPEAALRDILLGIRLRQAIAPEPTLISSLVDVTCDGMLMQPVWEGLQARRWNAAQLRELQAALSRVDVLAGYQRAVQAERALFMLPMIDDLHGAKNLDSVFSFLDQGGDGKSKPYWTAASYRLMPRGWFDEAKVIVSRLDQRYVINPVDADRHHMAAREYETGQRVIQNLPVYPTTVMARICLPVALSAAAKIAHGQTIIDQAQVACALERFFLDHQAYPPSLDALVPTYLGSIPLDVVAGTPLRHELTSAGRYRLWAVGWNGRDDHGEVAWQKDGGRLNDKQGDWLWQYETLVPPSPAGQGH